MIAPLRAAASTARTAPDANRGKGLGGAPRQVAQSTGRALSHAEALDYQLVASEYGFERVPPGWVGSWHPAPQRVLAIYLSGELEIEASDGEVRPIGSGTILLAEDTTGKGHRNLVTSPTALEMVFITLPDKAPNDRA